MSMTQTKDKLRSARIRLAIRITKLLAWIIGIIFLAIELREVFQLRQLTNIAFFAISLALASFQIACSDTLYEYSKALSYRAYQCSLTMFLASILSVLDAAIDQAIKDFLGSLNANFLLAAVFILSWILTATAALIAVQSLCSFLDILPATLAVKQKWKTPESD